MPAALSIFFVGIVFILLLLVTVTLYFYRVAVFRQQKDFLTGNPDLESKAPSEIPIADISWVDEQPFEVIEIKSYDGLLLRGYYLAAKTPTSRTVVLAHGYSGSAKLNMGAFAEFYHETLGFNVFMPDARGHGASQGNYIGFGWHERKDYMKWLQTLLQKIGEDAQLVLHGISMGAATVLMTGGEQLPRQVACIVADCAYTSSWDVLCYQARRMYKLPPFPFVYLTSLMCKLRAGYSFGEASALKQVAHVQVPVLFIHGDEDTFVPTEMVYRLYEQCPTYKELYLTPQAGHGMAYFVAPEAYIQKIQRFLAKCFSADEISEQEGSRNI